MTGHPAPEEDPAVRFPVRLIAFSDGVIAIAVTLLVLDLHPPPDGRHLLHGLLALWPSYASYVITFMLVAQVWAITTSCSTTSGTRTGWCCSSTRYC